MSAERAKKPTPEVEKPRAGSSPEAALAVSDAELEPLPSTGLLSFYDRLRERVSRFLERKGGRIGRASRDALLLVPDVFILLVRLALDRQVPKPTRALIGGAIAYFVLPADLLPELVLGPMGYMDDLLLSLGVLSHSFSHDLEPFAAKHWSGSGKLRTVLSDLFQSASSLVNNNLYDRLNRLLTKHGVDLDGEVRKAKRRASEKVVY